MYSHFLPSPTPPRPALYFSPGYKCKIWDQCYFLEEDQLVDKLILRLILASSPVYLHQKKRFGQTRGVSYSSLWQDIWKATCGGKTLFWLRDCVSRYSWWGLSNCLNVSGSRKRDEYCCPTHSRLQVMKGYHPYHVTQSRHFLTDMSRGFSPRWFLDYVKLTILAIKSE